MMRLDITTGHLQWVNAHPAPLLIQRHGVVQQLHSPTTLPVARGGAVVAELLDPGEAQWLQEQARHVRQGFMDPRQKAAFEEFLSRQASLDEQ